MLLQSQLRFYNTMQWQRLNLNFYVYERHKLQKRKSKKHTRGAAGSGTHN